MSASNKLWNFLLTSATATHFLIAWSMSQTLNPENPTASQRLMARFVPDELWPIMFGLCGILAFGGLFYTIFAQMYFVLAGTLLLAWAIMALSMPSPVLNAGGLLLLQIALLKFSYAFYAPRIRRLQKATIKLIEEVELAKEDLDKKT